MKKLFPITIIFALLCLMIIPFAVADILKTFEAEYDNTNATSTSWQIIGGSIGDAETNRNATFIISFEAENYAVGSTTGEWRLMFDDEQIGYAIRDISGTGIGHILFQGVKLGITTGIHNISLQHRRTASGNMETRYIDVWGNANVLSNDETLDFAFKNISTTTSSTSFTELLSGNLTLSQRSDVIAIISTSVKASSPKTIELQLEMNGTVLPVLIRAVSPSDSYGIMGYIYKFLDVPAGIHKYIYSGRHTSGGGTTITYDTASASFFALNSTSSQLNNLYNSVETDVTANQEFVVVNSALITKEILSDAHIFATIEAESSTVSTANFMISLNGTNLTNYQRSFSSANSIGNVFLSEHIHNMSEGTYNLSLYAKVLAGTLTMHKTALIGYPVNITDIFEVFIDNPPVSNLESPANNSITEDTAVTFQCHSDDDINLYNVTLYHNLSGTFESNETALISGIEVISYFNITIPLFNVIEWNCEVYDNNSQSSFADNNFILNVETDIIPPTITLISPLNNTKNNTFPLNISFTATDDGVNDLTCILQNSSYTFDERTFSQGTNYLTLQFGNLSELEQEFPNLEVDCYDNTMMNNSAVMNLNYTIDKILPLMTIISPLLNLTFNKVFVSSTQIHTTCFDNNAYRLNVTISNSSDIVFSEEDMTAVDGLLEINSIFDFSLLGTGIYEKSDYCADSHTAKNIPNYNTLKIADKGIRWTTPSGNEFELKCSYSEGILDYGTYKSPDNDKYIFYYIINDTEDGSEFEIECEMENRNYPVTYLSNSEYPAHFVMGDNWMDFGLEDDEDAGYDVTLNFNYNYAIIITTTKTNLTFGSVGELNIVEVISTMEIVYQPPREDEYVLGNCPVDTLPRAILFIFFIMLSFLIMGMGYALKNGLIGTIGSFMLVGMGVYTWFCLGFVSIIIMGLGVIMMSMFIFKGINAFR